MDSEWGDPWRVVESPLALMIFGFDEDAHVFKCHNEVGSGVGSVVLKATQRKGDGFPKF